MRYGQKETLRKIEEYFKENYQAGVEQPKDFYNFWTQTATCGRCHKEFKPFRFLFHFHLRKTGVDRKLSTQHSTD